MLLSMPSCFVQVIGLIVVVVVVIADSVVVELDHVVTKNCIFLTC